MLRSIWREAEHDIALKRGDRRELLEGMVSARALNEIVNLFAPDLVFETSGDNGVMPWVGRLTRPPP